MSQKTSLPQLLHSVQLVLTGNTIASPVTLVFDHIAKTERPLTGTPEIG
jgi:hypothetical protein